MATESRPGTDTASQRSGPAGQPNGEPSPDPGEQQRGQERDQDSQRDQGGSAREADPAAGRDLPDENGEPPSVKRPGGNPEESEPPVENI